MSTCRKCNQRTELTPDEKWGYRSWHLLEGRYAGVLCQKCWNRMNLAERLKFYSQWYTEHPVIHPDRELSWEQVADMIWKEGR